MKIFINLFTCIGLLVAEPSKSLMLQKRDMGEKEIVASVQVRIIVPDRRKTLRENNSIDSDPVNNDSILKPSNSHYMTNESVKADEEK